MQTAVLIGFAAWLSVAGNSIIGSSVQDQGRSSKVIAGIAGAPWVYQKKDPKTRKRLVSIRADSFEKTSIPSVFELKGVTAEVYMPATSSYSNALGMNALFDEKAGTLTFGTNLKLIALP